MVDHGVRVAFLALSLSLFSLSSRADAARNPAAGAPADDVPGVAAEARPAPETAATPEGFVYGPIRATDPETREQIKALYREQDEMERATRARLAELTAALPAADPDARLALQHEVMDVKRQSQIDAVEIGLEIARLNQDEVRVADFEKALDALLHPEDHFPATLDPSIARERARQLGLE